MYTLHVVGLIALSFSHTLSLSLSRSLSLSLSLSLFLFLSLFLSSLLLFGNGSHLKLCDFGTCRNLETNLLYTANIGTVRYMAPEVIKG